VQTKIANANAIESDTCQREDNMKTTLIKVKKIKINSHKHESDSIESECVQKQQLDKMTKIEVQSQPKVRDYQRKCALTIDKG